MGFLKINEEIFCTFRRRFGNLLLQHYSEKCVESYIFSKITIMISWCEKALQTFNFIQKRWPFSANFAFSPGTIGLLIRR